MENNRLVRSIDHTEPVNLRFVNLTTRNVEIVWINYVGQYVKYRILPSTPRAFIDVNTFKTHPWIAFDSRTKERLLLDHNFFYHPIPVHERFPEQNYPENTRRIVSITSPLYSLKFRTLLVISNALQNLHDCDELELPKELKEDIKRMITYRRNIIYV